MEKTETKDLNYYKNNCEEDYIKTPISVLRYISELEAAINYTHSCESDSELLFDFLEWFDNYCTVDIKPNKEDVELYLSK
jgi:hypothetical protein